MGKPKPRKPMEGSVKVYTIKFNFPVTDMEARAFVHKPNGDVAKELKKHLFKTLTYVCKQITEDAIKPEDDRIE